MVEKQDSKEERKQVILKVKKRADLLAETMDFYQADQKVYEMVEMMDIHQADLQVFYWVALKALKKVDRGAAQKALGQAALLDISTDGELGGELAAWSELLMAELLARPLVVKRA